MTNSSRQLRFASVLDVIQRLDPSYPVFCVFPDVLRARAKAFVEGFPGTVLYAVKCNPHAFVLRALTEGGVQHFDTASISEIAKVTEQLPDAHCYFNHPVKGRGALEAAADVYGIKDYVVDHPDELEKVVSIAGTDITVEVRIATPKGKAIYDLSAKFGATPDVAVALLKRANALGCRTALAFHVGSQCLDPAAFRVAMEDWEDELEYYTAKKKVCQPNCWLSALIFEETAERDAFVAATNAQNVQTRTLWPLANELPQFAQCQSTDVPNARWLQQHIAVLPGGVRV